MDMKRATLRDRNREAIAATPTPRQPPVVGVDETLAQAAKTPTRHTRAATLGERAVLSITVRPEDFEAAKAAYLSDWTREGRYDGFPKWLGAALRTHAQLTPEQRGAVEAHRPPKTTSRGLKRAFQMDPTDVELMRASIHEDLEHGRYSSEADWCGDALREAIDGARARAGGTLPTPPTRLPNRMPERY